MQRQLRLVERPRTSTPTPRIGALSTYVLSPGPQLYRKVTIYRNIVLKYAKLTGITAEAVVASAHSMRATAANQPAQSCSTIVPDDARHRPACRCSKCHSCGRAP